MENTNSKLLGLTQAKAQQNLVNKGYNELPDNKTKGIFRIIWDIITEPMLALLILSGLVYLLLGDPKEALLLLFFVFMVVAITFYQQHKTENSLKALRELSSPKALVIREGTEQRIPSREVVTEDVIVLSEGSRVPADAVVIECTNLSVDESFLTGESVPVAKRKVDESKDRLCKPGGENQPWVFSGSLVVKGLGFARVTSTGQFTEIGIIGKSLESIDTEKSFLQKEIAKLIRIMAIVGLMFCILLVLVYGLTKGAWLQAFLAGLTMAMGTLPEEFPIILTLFLAMGAWRLAKKKVLTKNATTIETLGSTTVLCVDKTGTITQNKMSLGSIFTNGKLFKASEAPLDKTREVIKFGILASQIKPFDPMERAFSDAAEKYGFNIQKENIDFVKEYPIEKNTLSMVRVWKVDDGYLIAAKGSPEEIIALCHKEGTEKEKLEKEFQLMAESGLRVLGVAKAKYDQANLPEIRHEFQFQFLGFVGLLDPIRPNISKAIQECFAAGVRVIMITGDYPTTALNIASEIGLESPGGVLTGQELESLKEDELIQKIKNINVFARIMPEQKLRIVRALKAMGEVVAMTGDGVNDAPALKSAHIGISMGHRGADVAREASSIVLLDDDFSLIVQGIRLGRRIYDNLKKATAYVFAVHIPIVGLLLIPVFLGWPLLLFPAHVVFLELIIDPACALAFEAEPEEEKIMKKPPRKLNQPVFSKAVFIRSLLQGIGLLSILIIVYKISIENGLTWEETRTITFITLVVGNILLILSNSSWEHSIIKKLFSGKNLVLISIITFAILLLLLVVYLPFLQKLFSMETPVITNLYYPLAATIIMAVWLELIRMIYTSKENY